MASFRTRKREARPYHRRLSAAVLFVSALAFVAVSQIWGIGPAAAQSIEGSDLPSGHFQVDRPAELSDTQALDIYLGVVDEMTAGYGLSEDPSSSRYDSWRRFNATPYRSATHGERFVNNYANMIGRSYGDYEALVEMPVGSVLAKDSFAVTDAGNVFLGPLFLMEKMADGFNEASRNWRYTMIMPDGSLFGQTKGFGSARVTFCITCHRAAGDKNDHLFFIPKTYRVNAGE